MRAYVIVQAGADPDVGAADAVMVDARAAAGSSRARLMGPFTGPSTGRLFVRIEGLDAPGLDGCLGEIAGLRPDAIVLPARHGRDVAHLGARLAVAEAEHGLPDGGTGIVALVACAAGVLAASSFAGASPRLRGLAWDARALARQLGLDPGPAEVGPSSPLAQARATIRLAAAAGGVEAIEAAYPGSDENGLAAHVASARRDGFEAVFVVEAGHTRLVRGGA